MPKQCKPGLLVSMNPILLKPQGDMTSQVIIKGKAVGKVSASDYYEQYFDLGWRAIEESLQHLQAEFDLIVCEGAGSPAEINLKHRDLTNMRVAKHLVQMLILRCWRKILPDFLVQIYLI